MKHSNVAIFVPHNGCPHCCSFCNQVRITGKDNQPKAVDIEAAVITAKESRSYNPEKSEIAFFGGSFTAIERSYMLMLLETAYKHVSDGSFAGIRISTRPDCIDNEILEILRHYGVTSIELGAQSMCDDVLNANKRGHTAEDVVKASELIKKSGFELGLQMMTGLYLATPEKDLYTAKRICELKPATVRIYPTIIMRDTLLADYYEQGIYRTYSLDDTVELCAELLYLFESNGIKVIRLGLHNTDDIAKGMLSGAWHPSFGELCFSVLYRKMFESCIEKNALPEGIYTFYVNQREISKALGQKKSNIAYFRKKGYSISIKGREDIEKYKTEFVKNP